MEEVDAIIIQALREIGCDLEDNIKLTTLKSEDVFKCLGKLCETINPDIELPKSLPGMAQRFAAATQIVECCKSIGFNGDLGYQTILYPNPIDIRRLFMFLIERAKASEKKPDQFPSKDVSKGKLLERGVLNKLSSEMKKPRVLEFLQAPSNISFPVLFEGLDKSTDDECTKYKEKFLPIIYHQSSHILASTICTHDVEAVKDSKGSKDFVIDESGDTKNLRILIPQQRSIQPSKTDLVEVVEITTTHKKASKVLTQTEIFSEKIDKLKEKVENQEEIYRNAMIKKNQLRTSIKEESSQIELMKKNLKTKTQISMLLDNPVESKQKLEESLVAAVKKRETLKSKYDSHIKPLLELLESFDSSNSVKIQKAGEKMKSVQDAKDRVNEIREDLSKKSQLHQHLQGEISIQTKQCAERSSYTSRIVDIVKNIKKQNNDINDILKDTKSIQKAINTIEGQLSRQFSVTEDLIWNNTSIKDEYSKKAYKLLITIHTHFSELVNLIEETGSVQREIRELEDQIDNERQQNIKQKIEQITCDLKMVTSKN